MIRAFLVALSLWVTSLATVLADSSSSISWIPGRIGAVGVRIPLVTGLSVDTVDPDLNVHILGASKQRTGTIQTLRSMAEMPGGLKLSKTSLAAQESCKAGVDLPVCKFSQFSRGAAHVAWVQIIHRPDMAFALKNIDLKRSREVLLVERHSGTLPVMLLQKNMNHPYGCPHDYKFGSCRMYMQVGSDLLAVMMFWRKDDVSSLTPFDQIANEMALTIKELIRD